MSDPQHPPESIAGRGMSRGLVLLFAVATGQAVACNYLAQPLLDTIRDVFGVSEAVAGLIVTAAQIGYAAGLILLLPLGDLFERRRAHHDAGGDHRRPGSPPPRSRRPSASSSSPPASIGLTSVMAQLLVPFAATLAPEAERGRVVGNVMSGLILGILLARTFSGLVAQVAGWRAVYVIAAVLMLVQAVAPVRQAAALPAVGRPAVPEAPRLRRWRIARGEPVLRRRALYGVSLVRHVQHPVDDAGVPALRLRPTSYSDGIIGLFGLVGAAGALTASVVGRFTDRGWVYWLTGGSALADARRLRLPLARPATRSGRCSSASWCSTSARRASTSATRARSTGCGRRRATASTPST